MEWSVPAEVAIDGPAVVRVMWDIENVACKNPINVKRALEIFLRKNSLLRIKDRMEITAYHDPRRKGAMSEKQVDTLTLLPMNLIDKGSKPGLADHCLARDCRNVAIDVALMGLRVRCVVIISSDSDYSAAGVYDCLNDAGIPLLIIHQSNINNVLLSAASEMRRFLHLEDLLNCLPAIKADSGVTASELLSFGSAASHDPASTTASDPAVPSAHPTTTPASAAPSVIRRTSIDSLAEMDVVAAEENMPMFEGTIVALLKIEGGRMRMEDLLRVLHTMFIHKRLTIFEELASVIIVTDNGVQDIMLREVKDVILDIVHKNHGAISGSQLGLLLHEQLPYTTNAKLKLLTRCILERTTDPSLGQDTKFMLPDHTGSISPDDCS